MENWNRAYREAPQIFDAFCRAEDPDGRITRSLLGHAAPRGRDVLELGCGTGRYTREWAPGSRRYVAVERSPAMLALARAAGPAGAERWLCADAARLPLAGDSFDAVLAGWLVLNLRPAARRSVLRETERVLRRGPGAGLWLVENHWTGQFQELRGRRAEHDRARVERLVAEAGFAVVEVLRTELRFPSAERAREVLGWLCGEEVAARLRRSPVSRLGHHVVILHRAAPRSPAG